MFIRFEAVQKPNSFNDCPITSLSWMRNEPDERNIPKGETLLYSPNSHHPNHLVVSLDGAAAHQSQQQPTTNPQLDYNNNGLASSSSNHHHHHHHHHHHLHASFKSNSSDESNNSRKSYFIDDGYDELVAKDGWLAVGNTRGVIGVCYTTTKPTSHSKAYGIPSGESARHNHEAESFTHLSQQATSGALSSKHSLQPQRTNYNLRGHRSEIMFVRWNEPYQKLATCDENGVIFIWIKYEGRWSIELINDRSTRVTDIAWSHDGRMALICYMDGFVLVGSVSGQRYWSSMLNLNDCNITCGTWSPNDQSVLFGTSNGHILVISVHGSFMTQVVVQECVEISAMCWSCRKFNVPSTKYRDSSNCWLAVSFIDGAIFVMRNFDDLDPRVIKTDLIGVRMDWSSDGRMLVVGGHQVICTDGDAEKVVYRNVVHFYSVNTFSDPHLEGSFMPPFKKVELQFQQQPLSALAWGNHDRRIYVACGQLLYVGWVFLSIPSLSFLSRHKIFTSLRDQSLVETVPVPEPLKCSISELFAQTICGYLPDYRHIRDFVFRPPDNNFRLYCTLMRHDEDNQCPPTPGGVDTATYILYLEYLGGLVPILKGKRSSKLKTEFVIYDPEMHLNSSAMTDKVKPLLTPRKLRVNSVSSAASYSQHNSSESESEASFLFSYLTPKTRRRLRVRSAQVRRYFRTPEPTLDTVSGRRRSSTPAMPTINLRSRPESPSFPVMDDLPEKNKIVLVASNLWGTKFKFVGLSPMLPYHLGSMTYRTSFLHLQPRQMTLVIKELNTQNTSTTLSIDSEPASTTLSMEPYGSTSCLISSDSEDEYGADYENDFSKNSSFNTPAVAPTMTPLRTVRNSMLIAAAPLEIQVADAQPVVHLEPNVQIQAQSAEVSNVANTESRLNDESNSIAARLANMTEEFLTLQINESESGRQTYSMEISSAPNRQKQREPAYYQGPISPDTETVQDGPSTSSSATVSANTMVQQFKHQTFQSESPKHVSYFHRQAHHNCVSSTVSKHSSPNISPSKNIRQKISSMKESPRKSSVSYCSTEFAASAKSYIEKLQHIHNSVCDNVLSDPRSSPFKTVKFKSCSSEAYSASSGGNHFFAGSPPYSAEAASITTTHQSRANSNAHQAGTMFFPNLSSKTNDLLNKLESQLKCANNQNHEEGISRPNSGQEAELSQASICPPMQTYHIYDDTSGLYGSGVQSSSEISISATQQRRHQFQCSSLSKHSKSFDSPLKTAAEPCRDSFELEQDSKYYLHNVEKVVKLLSDKLSVASVASSSSSSKQEIDKPDTRQTGAPQLDRVTKHSAHLSSSNLTVSRRSSLPFNNGALTTSTSEVNIQMASSRTPESLKHRKVPSVVDFEHKINNNDNNKLSKSKDLKMIKKTESFGSCSTVHSNVRSLPYLAGRSSSACQMVESTNSANYSVPNDTTTTNNKSKAGQVAVASGKRQSNGKHFFNSPNVIRKMRRKLSYLDCSSEEDNTSDDEDLSLPSMRKLEKARSTANSTEYSRNATPTKKRTITSTTTSSKSTPNSTPSTPSRFRIKRMSKHRNKPGEGADKEFSLHNKAPLWNEVTQVYQLDFGGRVTQESAKNFQIEHNGRQVMQFGRIDKNAYTLDFEYPFSAVQALAVALANVTQRFK